MIVARGAIVMVDYPFADRSGSKVRPALVVQDDHWNQRLQYTILAMITSSRRRIIGASTQLFVALGDPESSGTGLRLDSVVQCENLVTFQQSRIRSNLGRFSESLMLRVDDCLKASLGLK